MNNTYPNSPEELLKSDNSYLIVPHNTSNKFSEAFWNRVDDKSHTLASTKSNQREAYEAGVIIGWTSASKYLEHSGHNPNPAYMSKQEADDIMSIMAALGIQFEYMMSPPAWMPIDLKSIELHPGLNITKNIRAIKAGVVVSDEIKQQVVALLKQHTPEYIWKS